MGQTGDDTEDRTLAASRRPDEYEPLAIVDSEIDIRDGDLAAGKHLAHAFKRDIGHVLVWRGPSASLKLPRTAVPSEPLNP